MVVVFRQACLELLLIAVTRLISFFILATGIKSLVRNNLRHALWAAEAKACVMHRSSLELIPVGNATYHSEPSSGLRTWGSAIDRESEWDTVTGKHVKPIA